MDASAPWDMTPRQSVERECARRGPGSGDPDCREGEGAVGGLNG
jgi:hypothetical protein